MTQREMFEQWAVSQFGTIHRTVTGTYGGKNDPVQAAYEAWQARAEMAQEAHEGTGGDDESDDWNYQRKADAKMTNNDKSYTPNQALAEIRGCKPKDCAWVWERPDRIGWKRMSQKEAYRAAIEKNRDL